MNERDKEAFIREVFATRRGSVPGIFLDLTQLPFAFYVTTNYDTNIEDAFEQARPIHARDRLGARLPAALEWERSQHATWREAIMPSSRGVHGLVQENAKRSIL